MKNSLSGELQSKKEKTTGTCSYHSTCFDEYDAEKSKKPVTKATPVEIRKSKRRLVSSSTSVLKQDKGELLE